MMAAVSHSPDDLLTAVLHKVGREARIVDDFELAKIFDRAAPTGVGEFVQFKLHPQYHFSKLLSDTLQVLDHGGSIIRENPAQQYFRVSPHAAGPYGKEKFDALDPNEQRLVAEIAKTIQQRFGALHGSKRED
jgi:hypothetical protein